MVIRRWLAGRGARPARRASAAVQLPPPPSCPLGFLYTVQAGESLHRIARRFGVRPEDVLRANPQIRDPDLLFVGQVLCIPFVEPRCPTGLVLEVREGDTLWSIAREFGVSLQELIRLNPHVTDPNRLFPGQRLCLPARAAPRGSPGTGDPPRRP